MRPGAALAMLLCVGLLARPCRAEAESEVVLPDSPARPVELPFPAAPPRGVPVLLPEDLRARASSLSLADVIDVALRASPVTRESWARARASAAELREKRAPYYPTVDLTASAARAQQAFGGGQIRTRQTTYGPALGLHYLLLDFGGRRGDADEALESLRAAGWSHNAAIQEVVLGVERAYYDYLGAKAQLAASEANVKGTTAGLDAAEARRRAGVATVAEVLQARTARSQAELTRQTFDGAVRTLVGALATSMGLPANADIDVGLLPPEAPVDEVGAEVDLLIERALSARPDLAAARSEALAQAARVRSARSEGLPTVDLQGSAGRLYYRPGTYASASDTWSFALLARFPLFSGFEKEARLRRAREERVAAESRAESFEQQVVYEVWSSYYAVRTAADRVRTSRELLASAHESEQVALARYREGVGTILELLTAQSALALARAQEIEARSDWFVSVAQLARDTGALGPRPGAPSGTGESDAR